MKEFNTLIDETLNVNDLDELEAAADLFHYGLENGSYNKKQATEFNNVYWKLKNRFLAYECAINIKGSQLDIINIVASAPSDIKDDKQKLNDYVKNRMKAIKGNAKEKF
jgi:hypothetical protein